jgi:putative endonuclease
MMHETAEQGERPGHYVYMARCADGTLYTGYTNNVERRIAAHNAGTGARYTRSRRPISVIAVWSFDTLSEALQAEYAIKRLRRRRKLALAAGVAECGTQKPRAACA